MDRDEISTKADPDGIRVHSLSRYYSGEPLPGLLIALGKEPEERLAKAIEKLAVLVYQ
jgi:DNA-binding transcriptional MocR family regulator